MTFIMVILLGAGSLFVSSSLDCTPLVSTFQKIVSGQQIDWTGNNCASQPITFNLPSIFNFGAPTYTGVYVPGTLPGGITANPPPPLPPIANCRGFVMPDQNGACPSNTIKTSFAGGLVQLCVCS